MENERDVRRSCTGREVDPRTGLKQLKVFSDIISTYLRFSITSSFFEVGKKWCLCNVYIKLPIGKSTIA